MDGNASAVDTYGQRQMTSLHVCVPNATARTGMCRGKRRRSESMTTNLPTPEYKAYQRAYEANPVRKAIRRAYELTPLRRAYQKKYAKKYHSTPEQKERDKEYQRAYRRTQKGKIARLGYFAKRQRALGNNIINPEFAGTSGFHGHHIDTEHVIYVPIALHTSVRHSLRNKESMNCINTKVYSWLLLGL